MKGSIWLAFLSFLIAIFVGLLIYDNYTVNHYNELKQLHLVNNTSKPTLILPSIPFGFENIIFVVIVIIIIFGVFVGFFNYAHNR
jgi:hypothetical protein